MEFGYMSHALKRYGEIIREEAEKEFLEKGKLIGIDTGIGIGKVEGSEEKAISIARWMLDNNMAVEKISDATGLPIEKIDELKEENDHSV